jgi:hypothetical protein
VEHGAGMRIEAASPPGVGTRSREMTEQILEQAGRAGYRAALIDATDGTVTAWSRFARTVRDAARGLARRGLAPGDTAGVMVKDAASFAIAVNAVRAAGATVLSVGPDTSPARAAARLNAGGARLLITSATLAGPATEAADRSRVRQVIAFGDAPGTTPFSALLAPAGRGPRPGDEPVPAGRPRPGADARAWPAGPLAGEHELAGVPGAAIAPGGELSHRDVVVAGPPSGDGAAYTALLDLTLLTGATIVAAPLPLVAAATRVYNGTAVIVPNGTPVCGVAPSRVFTVA